MIRLKYNTGFTLVELLITMGMASIIIAVIVSAYQIQVKGKNAQEITIDMQNTARAAFEIIESDIRLAGCDPTGGSDAGISIAKPAELRFTMDVNGRTIDGTIVGDADGELDDLNEDIRYALTNDGDENGIADGTPCDLGRVDYNNSNKLRSFAENIDAINFVYLDSDGEVLDAASDSTTGVAPSKLEDIRSIQVTIVARSGEQLPGLIRSHNDTNTYDNASDFVSDGDPAYWDFKPSDLSDSDAHKFRRLKMTKIIYRRNIS